MKVIFVLLAFLTKNICLEVKFIQKTEFFVNKLNGEVDYFEYTKLNYECKED